MKSAEEKLAAAKKRIVKLKKQIELLKDEVFWQQDQTYLVRAELRDCRFMANAANAHLAKLTAAAPCLLIHTVDGVQPVPQTEQ